MSLLPPSTPSPGISPPPLVSCLHPDPANHGDLHDPAETMHATPCCPPQKTAPPSKLLPGRLPHLRNCCLPFANSLDTVSQPVAQRNVNTYKGKKTKCEDAVCLKLCYCKASTMLQEQAAQGIYCSESSTPFRLATLWILGAVPSPFLGT